jgi:hypothetical protein
MMTMVMAMMMMMMIPPTSAVFERAGQSHPSIVLC